MLNRPLTLPIQEGPLQAWIRKREEYLFDVIELEGPGPHSLNSCHGCKAAVTTPFRCSDCFGGYLYCADCIVSQHAANPLHLVKVRTGLLTKFSFLNHNTQVWNGSYFANTSLYTLGLSIQLGHPSKDSCLHPSDADPEFRVMHTNGIHRVRLQFCNCVRAVPVTYDRQLLQCGWWPASLQRPKTCLSISLLEHFHKQTLQGKVATFDFYRALELMTDNTGLSYLPVSILS